MTDEILIIVLKGLEGNDPTHLKGLQTFLEPQVDLIIIFWWTVFLIVISVVIFKMNIVK
jgi:hypothetical protein